MVDNPSVKKHVDYANQQVDEQAILDKYNAATAATFNVQKETNRQNENKFYNQMYNTQKTAMDTIRQSNAAAVSTGASRGIQSANELSSILGLQTESVASATELAGNNRKTSQEETAAVLQNVLTAYQQAAQEKAQLTQSGIEAASVDNSAAANSLEKARLITEAAENGTNTYLTALQQAGVDYSHGTVTPESQTSLGVAINNIGKTKDGGPLTFEASDWSGDNNAATKADTAISTITQILDAYGLDKTVYTDKIDAFKKITNHTDVNWINATVDSDAFSKFGVTPQGAGWDAKTSYAQSVQAAYQSFLNQIKTDYTNGINRKSK